MVIASSSSNYVARGLNNGSGTFNCLSFAVGDQPKTPVLADVNGDGLNDLLTANTYSADMTVRLTNGSGSLRGRMEFEVNNFPARLTVVDVNP